MARSSAFVGRADELRELAGIVTSLRVTGAAAGLVAVVGEAGIGKTRLLDQLVAAVPDPVRVVRGRADELDATAFGMWLPVLTRLGLPRPGTDPSVPSDQHRWEVVDLLAAALDDMAPVLVVLDDLHWADDDSLWVCEHLLDRLGQRPASFLAATRPAEESRSARWHGLYRRAQPLRLEGLSTAEIAELAAAAGVDLADPLLLRQRTGGNPLFVREQLSADGPAPTATVESLLTATIERLPPLVAEVLSCLSLAGADTPVDVVGAALSVPTADLEAALVAARRADLLVEDEGTVRFRHDLLSEVAARRVAGRRAELHQALAEAWAARRDLDAVLRSARHRVLATPLVTDGEAAVAALAAAASLSAAGRRPDAAGLLLLARRELGRLQPLGATLSARLALTEGELRWAMDDFDGASDACAAALALANDVAPDLAAAIEVAALRHHSPFAPDPIRLERLAALDDALARLPDVDPVLRVRLRGRRAFLLMTAPNGVDEAVALGDSVIEEARRIGDPDVLVGALRDRCFVLRGPDDHEARAAASREILDLARAARRPDLAFLGHEWSFASRIGRGDLAGAVAALDDLEALAAIMPSPMWRYSATVRRSGACALLGDYEGALQLAEVSATLAQGVVPEVEAAGLELALRASAALLYGRDDHGAEELVVSVGRSLGRTPVLFLQAMQALPEACVGDLDSARRRITPWLGRFGQALEGHEGLPAVAALAEVATRLRWVDAAAELRGLLRPFAGMMPVGSAIVVSASVDQHLAELGLLLDDLVPATEDARNAVSFARRMRSPALEARALALLARVTGRTGDAAAASSARDAADTLAAPLGVRLDGGRRPRSAPSLTPSGDERCVTMHLEAGRWTLDGPFGRGVVPDAVGVRQLVRLLTSPGHRIAATDLAATGTAGPIIVSADLGPALDARAKREYRRRLTELESEVDEAEANNDLDRAAKHQLELDALIAELRAAVGIGGRDRPQGSSSERARINVARTVRRAISAVSGPLPELGAHLQVSIQTGHHCAYAPEPAAALTWRLGDSGNWER